MSEEQKVYKITKATIGSVFFKLTPFSNPALTRKVHLHDKQPYINLPEDWALGIFVSEALYKMFKEGIFIFEKQDEIVKKAQEKGVFFDEIPPQIVDITPIVKASLLKGGQANINKAIAEHGKKIVIEVAKEYIDDLSNSTIDYIQAKLNVQLRIDGE